MPAGVISNAKLIEHLKESEINLNMRSADFGNVAIHSVMSRERLATQISLERNELSKAIANEAPVLQSKLSQEHGIQATIEVQQRGASFSGDSGQSQSHAQRPQQPVAAGVHSEETQESSSSPIPLAMDGRLDIRI